jgi:hypothetical protein
MSVFIIQNQHKQFLNKNKEWVTSGEAQGLFFSAHQDTALNQLIEINARDYTLRCELVTCELNSKGLPVIPAEASNEDTELDVSEQEPAEEQQQEHCA